MITTITRFGTISGMSDLNRMAPLCLAALLTFGLFFMNLREGASFSVTSQALPEAVLAPTVGANPGACGIFAGIAIGVVAAAAGGVTVGFGAALAISAGLHVSAALCATR